jgi:hypothetical protein
MFGNDFSAVQAADLQDRALQQQAAEASINRFIAQRQFQQQMAQQNRQFQYQTQVYNPQEFAFRNRQLGIEEDLATRRIMAEEDRNRVAKGYLDIYSRQAPEGAALTPSQVRDQEFTFNAAAQDAEHGLFDNPDHVQQLYPTLTPAQARVMAQRSASVRPILSQQYVAGDRAAALLNAYESSNQTLKDAGLKDGQEPEPIYTTGDPREVADTLKLDPKAVKKAQWRHEADDTATINRKAAVIQAYMQKGHLDKMPGFIDQARRSGLVSYDPQSSTWGNAVSQPRWMQPPAAPPPPDGWQPTGAPGDNSGWLRPAPGGGRNLTYVGPQAAPAGPTMPPVGMGGNRMPAQFYALVNQYASQGLNMADATDRAKADWSAAQASGNTP